MQSSLLKFYGLHDNESITCQSIQFDSSVFNEIEIAKEMDQFNQCEFILFLSIKTVRITDCRMPVDQILKQKFNLHCKAIYEQREKEFDGIKRSCAVLVPTNQIVSLARVLFDFSCYAFAMSNTHPGTVKLTKKMIAEFNFGPLTSSILGVCCKTALSNNSSFFHILKGYDGYSVNILHPQ